MTQQNRETLLALADRMAVRGLRGITREWRDDFSDAAHALRELAAIHDRATASSLEVGK